MFLLTVNLIVTSKGLLEGTAGPGEIMFTFNV